MRASRPLSSSGRTVGVGSAAFPEGQLGVQHLAAQRHLYFTGSARPAERFTQVLRGRKQLGVLPLEDEVSKHRVAIRDQPGPAALPADP